MLYVGFIL